MLTPPCALSWQVFYREIVLSSLHPLSGPREGGTAITWQVLDSDPNPNPNRNPNPNSNPNPNPGPGGPDAARR